MNYKNYEDRPISTQYRDLLAHILNNGVDVDTQLDEGARRVEGYQMRFRLEDGFPLITERDIASAKEGNKSIFQQALGELFAFLAGEHTQEGLEKYGCSWWKAWVTPEKCAKRGLEAGDLGPGSYGPAWRDFPTKEGCGFDQVTHLIEQIEDMPHLRTHVLTPWIPQYIGRGRGKQQKVVVAPCHGYVHILIDMNTKNMTLHHFQRSADTPVGLPANMIQYAALLMMIAQVTGYNAHELVYTISDAHMYLNQIEDVKDLLATEPQRLPTVKMDPTIKNIFDFRPEHFTIEDYNPQLSRRRIVTPV